MSGTNWLAWREILAEVLEGFTVEENVAPAWLVNPETGRQLKLDLLYPQIGLAVRFRGARARQQRRRVSDEERDAEERREQVRRELCASHGITLVTLDVQSDEVRRQLDALYTALSRATREIAHSARPQEEKLPLLDALAQARRRLSHLRDRIRRPEMLEVYADKWRDRETRALREARSARPPEPRASRRFRKGMRVRHERFGEGVVVDVQEESNGDQQVVIDFPTAGRRTFLASLVAGKLQVL
ncbi:MAG: hypothetical protein GXO55_07535 [Chloroflexi bacterium]|nr:hypothetical protein [Chloroflexota bacterium]